MKLIFCKRVFFVALILILPACTWFENKNNVIINSNLKIVNVNDKNIYDDAHIKGDINITFDELDNLPNIVSSWSKVNPVVFYCTDYRCVACEYFAKSLVDLGFEKVYTYKGGIVEWYQLSRENKHYEIEGTCKESYLNVLVEPMASNENLDKGFAVITAQQLLQMINDFNLLKK